MITDQDISVARDRIRSCRDAAGKGEDCLIRSGVSRVFEVLFSPLLTADKVVFVPQKDIEEAERYAAEWTNTKSNVTREQNYLDDGDNLPTRGTTGYVCERAVELLFGLPRFSIVDPSQAFASHRTAADLRKLGYNVGVKGALCGKVPLVHHPDKHSSPSITGMAQIIVVAQQWRLDYQCFVLGVVSPGDLADKHNLSRWLVIDPKTRAREDKVGFYGAWKIRPLSSDIEESLAKYRFASAEPLPL